ncbi:MAG: hypothetical protein ABSA74_02170 [Candidatus Staskawiczbacteria bacterium]|jgi:hypothetical protein
MEEDKKQYLALLSEIVAKAMVIFGPDMAVLKARLVSGLIVDSKGNVTDIQGYIADATKALTDEYLKLSDQSMKSAIDSIFAKYPQISKIY